MTDYGVILKISLLNGGSGFSRQDQGPLEDRGKIPRALTGNGHVLFFRVTALSFIGHYTERTVRE